MSETIYDYIIVGSGTSGGVWAHYLSLGGKKVLLLDAGKNHTSSTYPNNEMDYNSQLFWNGAMELNKDASLVFLRAKVVGGGSVINQCLLDRFDEVALEDWKKDSGIEFFTPEGMNPHYTAVEQKIHLEYIPEEQRNRNAEIFIEGFEKLGLGWEPLRRGQVNCKIEEGNDCIVCLGGCPRDSKQSIPVVFLPEALKAGLILDDETEVTYLEYSDEYVTVHGTKKGEEQIFKGRKCVLASGSLGTTKLLLQSGFGNKLPALGRGFFCHPQLMTFAIYDEPVYSHKGAFQSVKSSDSEMRSDGYKLENVFAPPIAISLLYKTFGKKHHDFMAKLDRMACIEVAVRDTNPGSIKLDKKGKLVISKSLNKEDKRRAKKGLETVRKIFEVTGAKEIYHSPFSFGLHLMGGCSIGTDPSHSVVNDRFEVHGYPNLLISDSSVFPNAPGINPALTIMALSHRASKIQLEVE